MDPPSQIRSQSLDFSSEPNPIFSLQNMIQIISILQYFALIIFNLTSVVLLTAHSFPLELGSLVS